MGLVLTSGMYKIVDSDLQLPEGHPDGYIAVILINQSTVMVTSVEALYDFIDAKGVIDSIKVGLGRAEVFNNWLPRLDQSQLDQFLLPTVAQIAGGNTAERSARNRPPLAGYCLASQLEGRVSQGSMDAYRFESTSSLGDSEDKVERLLLDLLVTVDSLNRSLPGDYSRNGGEEDTQRVHSAKLLKALKEAERELGEITKVFHEVVTKLDMDVTTTGERFTLDDVGLGNFLGPLTPSQDVQGFDQGDFWGQCEQAYNSLVYGYRDMSPKQQFFACAAVGSFNLGLTRMRTAVERLMSSFNQEMERRLPSKYVAGASNPQRLNPELDRSPSGCLTQPPSPLGR